MKILYIEPYYTGSHQQWIEAYQKYSRHEIDILSFKLRLFVGVGICNFPEKNIAGVKSEFLVLGAIEEDGKVVLVNPSQPTKNGLKIA